MKKLFFLKISIYLIPMFLLMLNFSFYQFSSGDLSRIGKVSISEIYRDKFAEEFRKIIKYKNLYNIDHEQVNSFDILTIGDSFSKQKEYGYQNYLASNHDFSVLDMSNSITYDSVLQFCFELINGDFFDEFDIKYLILENVERTFLEDIDDLNFNKSILLKDLHKNTNRQEEQTYSKTKDLGIFKESFLYLYYNLSYNFNKKPYGSKVYKRELNTCLFSTDKNELLFYEDDIKKIKYSTKERIGTLNSYLNLLSEKCKGKGIYLIVLVCPDKYDLYYPFISNNDFHKNYFFDHFKQETKKYSFIESKDLLSDQLHGGIRDLYFADDTHWSPIASELIAEEIFKETKYLE